MESVVQVSGLTKTFGKKTAVNNISFEVKKGDVFGLLGPNGGGKTTTLSTILTLLKPTSGSVSLFGSNDLTLQLKRVGVLLESASYYSELSAKNNLLITCKIKNADAGQIDSVLQRVGLLEDRNNKVRSFSLGMKQRLAIGAALINNPELLIFDEPTNGLDPIGIAEVRDMIKSLAAEGKTILIASHLLAEMERICTHIAILKKGNVIAHGPLKELMAGHASLEDYFLTKTVATV